ncbi:MAG TPA: DinB family protein [Acidimicrobiia bacterium]
MEDTDVAHRPDALDVRWQTERCPECAFDPEKYGPADVPAAVGGLGRRYRAPLERLLPGETPDILRARPLAGKWSALAYACHVRDVLILFDGRIQRMLAEANPDLGWWDHQATVEADAYDSQDPAEVADALAANAAGLAATLSGVPDNGWRRTGRRGAGQVFTVLGASRFILHEGHHHLLDLGRVLRAARGR